MRFPEELLRVKCEPKLEGEEGCCQAHGFLEWMLVFFLLSKQQVQLVGMQSCIVIVPHSDCLESL